MLYVNASRSTNTDRPAGVSRSNNTRTDDTDSSCSALSSGPSGPPLPLVMIIDQVRATAFDLLRGLGADDAVVLSRVDAALGLPPA